ncbi:MAG: glycosyltransferase family 1 protein [Patescibacteria group bacterium]|nr:glycosyltransferase family 1 protein [Patescibacteria group bacterium]
MRIAIDARFFGPFGKGLGRYTEKLIKYLEKVDQKNDYTIFLRKENFDYYKVENKNFKKALADFKWYTLNEQINMPKVLKKGNFDLVHFPHFNVPLLYKGNFVVTVHDLILLDFPTKRATTLGPIKYALKNMAYKKVISSAVRKCKKVITVSKYTKKRLIEHFNLDDEKIVVTYESCEKNNPEIESTNKDFLKLHKIEKPYLLYVGNAYPHKNLERLLKVFKKLRKNNFDYQLVLVGKKDYFYQRLQSLARELGLLDSGEVVFFGFAKDSELAGLYQNASLYVFPSFIEGFGLPPLEAMSYGLPVVTAKTSCLPEILGEAAKYFDPKNDDDIANVILKVLNDNVLKEEMKKLGLVQVKKYSWERCAKETLDVYQSILE